MSQAYTRWGLLSKLILLQFTVILCHGMSLRSNYICQIVLLSLKLFLYSLQASPPPLPPFHRPI